MFIYLVIYFLRYNGSSNVFIFIFIKNPSIHRRK